VEPQRDQRLNVLHHTKPGLPVVCLLMPGETEVTMQIVYFDFEQVVMYFSLSLSRTTTGIGHVRTYFQDTHI
jgi:hypothetical protein